MPHSDVIRALGRLAAVLEPRVLHFDEAAKRSYYYDVVYQKRLVPDASACEICEEAADEGWIEDGAVFDGVFGDEDGPPLHPHCGCGLEYRERRVRVYV